MRRRRRLSKLFIALVLALTYLPVLAVVVYSFNASKIASYWQGFSLRWYAALFRDRELLAALLNSVVVAASAALAAAVLGTLSALVLERPAGRAREALRTVVLLPLIIPEIILGMVFMAFYNLVRLPPGFATLIVSHATFCVPYVMIIVGSRLVGYDRNLTEAARDLGASPLRAFLTVELPYLAPAVLSGSLLAFAMSFDDVIVSVFVTGPRVATLPLKIYTSMKTSLTPEINALGALTLLASVLALAGFFLLQRRNHDEKSD